MQNEFPALPLANVDTSQSDYIIGALTATDIKTKLEWQRMDDDIARSWADAWQYCAFLSLDNHFDWRLPEVKELQSIVDYGSATSPLIDPVAYTNANSGIYWSSTTGASNSGAALGIDFARGSVGGFSKVGSFFVRCVR